MKMHIYKYKYNYEYEYELRIATSFNEQGLIQTPWVWGGGK